MTTLSGLFLAFGLLLGEAAPQKTDETVSELSRSAAAELEKGIQQLARLREEIEAEKLPLAQELTALEERVDELRDEHGRITRTVDAGKLGIGTLEKEMELRRNELSYVNNLLDEYIRRFETSVNVAELQSLAEAIAGAKQAVEDTGLSLRERFTLQIGLIDTSVRRLFDAIGGMRFPGVGVDQQGSVAEGQFALIGPVALFCAQVGGAAGLVLPQTGSTLPLIRPLEGALQLGLTSLVQSGEGTLPLDPTRGGALKALVQKTNLIHIFEKGGPIMWPLLLASVLALGTVLERLLFLFNERRKRDPEALERLLADVEQRDIERAVRDGSKSKFFVVRALTYALGHRETSLANAVMYAQAQELKRYRRGIPILDTVITLAPLLGLLGTVTGMMGSFSLIGGELSAPGAITGGIAEALIATAFGLGIAITALLPFNFLNTRMEDARHEIESAATQLELLLRAPDEVIVHTPTAAHAPAAALPTHARRLVAKE